MIFFHVNSIQSKTHMDNSRCCALLRTTSFGNALLVDDVTHATSYLMYIVGLQTSCNGGDALSLLLSELAYEGMPLRTRVQQCGGVGRCMRHVRNELVQYGEPPSLKFHDRTDINTY